MLKIRKSTAPQHGKHSESLINHKEEMQCVRAANDTLKCFFLSEHKLLI